MSKQKLSLQEQLLKSGLASSAQAKKVQADKRKQSRMQTHNNATVVDEAKELALKIQAEKAGRDRELNQLRHQQEAQKALVAQVKQLIEQNRQPQDTNGVAYHFTDNGKVKTLYVSETQREHIIKGRAAVVKFDGAYDVVAAETAKKIGERMAGCVIVCFVAEVEAKATDDPYAGFEVPDDLMW
ncbi:MAG: DUF2058 domain-containing protein [Methylovulum sp.]|uniref:DUF2058 domain-containing protein n=1 Tax=Methylovulum sp. TaxID=1916980 RepID=UPI00261A8B36|nr:DUF2058 domain-containing protein [Methylovulum sp.]MDD2725170.1 DUF2058 domain-containing protein [Methylovulum sp.]MDD5124397.1 DUF2058 domain-containing protein [Methylovulum sp.]